MSQKKTAVVVCPGRGTYTKKELGYLAKYLKGECRVDKKVRQDIQAMLDESDQYLSGLAEPTISELDNAEKFSFRTHTPGEYASALIYACSAADYFAIDRDQFDIVAVTGNSMGWYTALGLAGALPGGSAIKLIHTMGSMMKDDLIGGQLIYPVLDDDWQPDPAREGIFWDTVDRLREKDGYEIHLSIRFGGYVILGANQIAMKALLQELPQIDERYPFQLINHGAFHTPMMGEISKRALKNWVPICLPHRNYR